MSQFALGPDPLVQASIARRQKLEEERKQRFFNPRTRCLGIDVQTLEEQIGEKKLQKQQQLDCETNYADYMKQTTDLLQYIDTKRKEHAKQEAHDLTRFRQQHQQAPARREWDLNDPQRLLKDLPARVSDTDARCGVSSLQKFDGEDLKGAERERLQKLQVRAWAYEGRIAKERARREEEALKCAERDYLATMETRRRELLALEAQYRRDKNFVVKEVNHKLAEEKRVRDETEARRHGEVNTLVVPAMADLQLDRPHIWKYMSQEERDRILSEEQQSKAELKDRAEAKKKEEAEWHAQSVAISKAAELVEQEKLRIKKEKAASLATVNAQKAEEDRNRQQQLDRVVYTNKPTAAYFGQFNTSSR